MGRTSTPPDDRLAVTLTVADIRQLVGAAVAQALAHAASPALSRSDDRLTVDEVAAELRCSQRQVRRLIAAKRLRAIKLRDGGSSRVLVARSEVERLLVEATR